MISSLIQVSARFAHAFMTSAKLVSNRISKILFSQRFLQSVRHMKISQRQNSARLGRKPFDRAVFHRHRKNTEPVSLSNSSGSIIGSRT